MIERQFQKPSEFANVDADGNRINLDLDENIQKQKDMMQMWLYIYNSMTSFQHLDYLFRVSEWPLIGSYARNYINKHLAFIYEVSTIYIICVRQITKDNEDVFATLQIR